MEKEAVGTGLSVIIHSQVDNSLTRIDEPPLYNSSACALSRSVRDIWGAASSNVSSIGCKALNGVTMLETPRHEGQLVPPFYKEAR